MAQEQESSLFGMELDGTAQNHLGTISKWGKFIAITFIICLALFLILMAVLGSKLMELGPFARFSSTETSQAMTFIIIVIVIAVGLVGTLAYFLLRATTLIKKALITQSVPDLNLGLMALKNYFVMNIVLSTLSILSTLFTLLS